MERGERGFTDGPFAETGHLVAGFWIWQVADMDEAIAWVKTLPTADARHEPRWKFAPSMRLEDFAPEMTPEQAAQEEELRERVAASTE